MPLLKKLSIQNLKGPAGDYQFGQATIIAGPNISGKTRILHAIQLALLGYVTGLAKTKIGDLMSGNPMAVFAHLGTTTDDNEIGVERTYTRSGEKLTSKASQHGGPGIDLVNPDSSAVAILDADKFMGSGETDRVRMIWDLMDITSKDQTADKILESVPKREELAKNVPRGTTGEPPPRPGADFPKVSFQDWLGKAIAYAKDALKLAKQVVARLDQTQRGLVALGNDQVAGNPEEIEEEIKTLEARRNERQEALAALKGSGTDVSALLDRIKRLKGQRAAKADSLDGWGDPRHIQSELSEDRKTLEDMGDVAGTVAESEKRLEAARKALGNAKDAVWRVESKLTVAQERDSRAKAQAEIKTCSHCGAKLTKEKIAASKEELAAAQKELAMIESEIATAKQSMATAESDLKLAQAEFDTIRRCDHVRTQIDHNSNLLVTIAGVQNDIKDLDREIEEAETSLPPDDDKLAQAIDQEETSIQDIQAHVLEAKGRLRVANQAQSQKALRAQAELQSTKDRTTVEEWQQTLEILEVTQQNMIDCAFTELIGYIQPVLQGILKTPLGYEDGSLGRWDKIDGNDRFIKLSTFSGMETLLVTIGLQAALGSQARNKIVIFDELGRIDATNKIRLLKNLAGMIKSGQIEQFIGVDVDPAPYKKVKDLVLIETSHQS